MSLRPDFLTDAVIVRDKTKHDKSFRCLVFFYVTCDVIGDPGVNDISFLSISFQGLSRAV